MDLLIVGIALAATFVLAPFAMAELSWILLTESDEREKRERLKQWWLKK